MLHKSMLKGYAGITNPQSDDWLSHLSTAKGKYILHSVIAKEKCV